ncbi:MAG: flavin reductase [Verrucomicrobia bacterium]|nr:flavin reductase [Verrucomicrobiota bacterium]
MKKFAKISPNDLNESSFRMIGKEWMLITAGTMQNWNTMTASWGAMGELWFKPVAFTFLRPQRYTLEFVEREPVFTLSFFDDSQRDILSFCGSHSGRDCDKAAAAGLTPFATPYGSVAFEEARVVIECRKLFAQDLDPNGFIDDSIIPKCYPFKDFHRMFVGEVLRVLKRGA